MPYHNTQHPFYFVAVTTLRLARFFLRYLPVSNIGGWGEHSRESIWRDRCVDVDFFFSVAGLREGPGYTPVECGGA